MWEKLGAIFDWLEPIYAWAPTDAFWGYASGVITTFVVQFFATWQLLIKSNKVIQAAAQTAAADVTQQVQALKIAVDDQTVVVAGHLDEFTKLLRQVGTSTPIREALSTANLAELRQQVESLIAEENALLELLTPAQRALVETDRAERIRLYNERIKRVLDEKD